MVDDRRFFDDLPVGMHREVDLSGLSRDGLLLVGAYAMESHLPHVAIVARQEVVDALRVVVDGVWAALKGGGRPDSAPLSGLRENSRRGVLSARNWVAVSGGAVVSGRALVAAFDGPDTEWLVKKVVGNWHFYVQMVDALYRLPPGLAERDVQPYEGLRLGRIEAVVDLVRKEPFGPGLVDRVREQAVTDGALVGPHALGIRNTDDGTWPKERPEQEQSTGAQEPLAAPQVLVARQDSPPAADQSRDAAEEAAASPDSEASAGDVVWPGFEGEGGSRFRFGDLGRVPDHVGGWDDPPDLPVRGAVVEFVPGYGEFLGPLIAVADDGSVVWVDAEVSGLVQRMADSWDVFEKGFAIADRWGRRFASLELDEVDDAFAQAQEELAQVSPGLVMPLCTRLYMIMYGM